MALGREYRSWEIDPVLAAHKPYNVGELVNLPRNDQKPARRGLVVDLTKDGVIADGDPIRLEVEGIFRNSSSVTYGKNYTTRYGGHVVSTLDTNTTLASFTKYATILKLEQPPTWRAGDVIDVKFNGEGPAYTYVCDGNRFPGNTRHLSFDRVNEMWSHGDVEIVRKK